MDPSFVFVGRLTRDYILPPEGEPVIDAPGGDVLHAAGGAGIWNTRLGLVGRVGEDYPRQWLQDLERRGFDVAGIRIQTDPLDLRSFIAYSESFEVNRINPVSHFARRGVPFPKSLIGFQTRQETRPLFAKLNPATPSLADLPAAYIDAGAFHLCPLELPAHQKFADTLRGAVRILTLEPSSTYMTPASLRDVRGLVNGLTAFLPSLEDLKALFMGQTHDVWEMAAAIGEYGCEYVVIKCGERGQLLYDSVNKRRWEIPAYPTRPADPTGVGSAFCGGFLVGYRNRYDPLEGALYGNISASLAIEGSGPLYPLDVMPGLAEARLASLRDMVRNVSLQNGKVNLDT